MKQVDSAAKKENIIFKRVENDSLNEDSLTCVDELTYRDLVVSKLSYKELENLSSFQDENLSLCLKQNFNLDSSNGIFKNNLDRSLQVVDELDGRVIDLEKSRKNWV
mgnify:CR=1 FL=1